MLRKEFSAVIEKKGGDESLTDLPTNGSPYHKVFLGDNSSVFAAICFHSGKAICVGAIPTLVDKPTRQSRFLAAKAAINIGIKRIRQCIISLFVISVAFSDCRPNVPPNTANLAAYMPHFFISAAFIKTPPEVRTTKRRRARAEKTAPLHRHCPSSRPSNPHCRSTRRLRDSGI